MITPVELKNRFKHHPPDEHKIELHTAIRIKCFDLAMQITEYCPEGREQSLAITKLEEVMFWANAAIARSE